MDSHSVIDTIYYPPVSSFAPDVNKIYIGGFSKDVIIGRPPTAFLYNLIAYSEDHGQTWNRIESPLDSIMVVVNEQTDTLSVITDLYPDGDHIMIGMCSFNYSDDPWLPAYGGGFYHLYFTGSEWIIADTAFTNTSVFGFASNNSTIFIAIENGVYSTNDYGASWHDINMGMANIHVNNLFVTESNLISSTANGVWKISSSMGCFWFCKWCLFLQTESGII
jgi:hypothetical protein